MRGEKTIDFLANETLLARGGEGRISHREVDNSDNYDHLVTYEIHFPVPDASGGVSPDLVTWLIFWEDAFLNEPSDLDYNDLVVQIQAKVAVPEPASAAPMALGLLGCAVRPSRTRRPAA